MRMNQGRLAAIEVFQRACAAYADRPALGIIQGPGRPGGART